MSKQLQALIFDSVFNPFRGIIAYFRILNGSINKGDHVKFVNTEKEYDADEIGVLRLKQEPRGTLKTGDVGYIISGIKTSSEVKVGDTVKVVMSAFGDLNLNDCLGEVILLESEKRWEVLVENKYRRWYHEDSIGE